MFKKKKTTEIIEIREIESGLREIKDDKSNPAEQWKTLQGKKGEEFAEDKWKLLGQDKKFKKPTEFTENLWDKLNEKELEETDDAFMPTGLVMEAENEPQQSYSLEDSVKDAPFRPKDDDQGNDLYKSQGQQGIQYAGGHNPENGYQVGNGQNSSSTYNINGANMYNPNSGSNTYKIGQSSSEGATMYQGNIGKSSKSSNDRDSQSGLESSTAGGKRISGSLYNAKAA